MSASKPLTSISSQASERASEQHGTQPPGYDEVLDDGADRPIGPITLVLSNHHIISHSPSDPNPQPLYELNRGVASLSQATSTVTFSRLDHTVRKTPEGDPMIKERKRHLYDLEHASKPLLARYAGDIHFKNCPPYWCKSAVRKTAGDLGLKIESKFMSTKTAYKVFKVKRDSGEYGEPGFLRDKKGGEPLPVFEVGWQKKLNVYLWTDGSGNEVAVESTVDGAHKLEVAKELQREMLDALVALWCARIWSDSAAKQEKGRSSEGLGNGMCPSHSFVESFITTNC